MARDGSKQREAYAAIEKLVADGKISKQEAFKRHAEKIGARAGTVAANYYREARRHEGAVKRRVSRKKVARPAPSRTSSNGRGNRPEGSSDLDALLASLVGSITALTEAVKEQRTETEELRDRLDQVRSALG